MFQTGIITAPRESPTIQSTITSLRKIGYKEKIFIYAEPDSDLPTDENIDVRFNKEKLGCFRNFDNALRNLITSSDHDFICVLSDDFRFSSRFWQYIRYSYDGYHALYTPKGLRFTRKVKRGWNKFNEGWAGTWGGNYMMHKDIAQKIINHPSYKEHFNYEANQQIDHIIPKVCFEIGLNQYFHNPSPTDHIGMKSTIGHVHKSQDEGLDFKK